MLSNNLLAIELIGRDKDKNNYVRQVYKAICKLWWGNYKGIY